MTEEIESTANQTSAAEDLASDMELRKMMIAEARRTKRSIVMLKGISTMIFGVMGIWVIRIYSDLSVEEWDGTPFSIICWAVVAAGFALFIYSRSIK